MKIHFKKIVVSFFVILGFVFYVIYQRNYNGQQNFVVNPQTTSSAVAQSFSDLASSTTESQASSNPPLTLSGNENEYGNADTSDDENESDDENGSYTNQSSQSTSNHTTATDSSTTGTTSAGTSSTTSTTAAATTTVVNGQFKDGQYDGSVADAYYGNVQVRAIIQDGKLTDVQFLSYPNDRNQSIEINSYALPILKSEAIKVQSAHVNIISGATNTSNAFINSLTSALNQAKV